LASFIPPEEVVFSSGYHIQLNLLKSIMLPLWTFLQEISVVLSSGEGIGVLPSLPLLKNGERTLEKWFGLRISLLRYIEVGQATESLGSPGILKFYNFPDL
jgi:hypothetical protein